MDFMGPPREIDVVLLKQTARELGLTQATSTGLRAVIGDGNRFYGYKRDVPRSMWVYAHTILNGSNVCIEWLCGSD